MLQSINAFLSSARLLHFTLPVLMVYLVIGTIAQKYIGLYASTQIFFSAPVIWVYDAFPLPGMPVIVALIFLNLAFKLIFKSPWTLRNAGIILTHIGAILLLLGGLFTALFSNEGYLDIAEGESSAIVSDYHMREFVITNTETNAVLHRFNHDDMHAGQTVTFGDFPINLEVIEYCKNCEIVERPEDDKSNAYMGMAQHMKLMPKAAEHNDEENFAGLTFSVGVEGIQQVFVALEEVPRLPKFTIEGVSYQFELRRQQRALPFRVELLDFEAQHYPGTQMAQSYQSRVLIHDEGKKWESTISMNAPLRYKGYTLFQSSFARTPDGREVSVLAVVWNAGRSFPYLSGIVMCIGLLLHLFMRQRKSALMLIAFASVLLSDPAQAKDASFEKLAQVPILHEGRIKPMDSFARAVLKDFSGRDDGAMLWLVQAIFDPARAEALPIIKVTNPDVRQLLNLPQNTNRLYSSQEILKGILPRQSMIEDLLKSNENDLSNAQKDLLKLHRQITDLQDILSSVSLYIPLSMTVPDDAPASLSSYAGKRLSIADLKDVFHDLKAKVRSIVQEKGEDISTYDHSEQELAHLLYATEVFRATGQNSLLFKSVPLADGSMVTPWQAHLQERGDETVINLWSALAHSYHDNEQDVWNRHIDDLYAHYYDSDAYSFDKRVLWTEYYYNKYDPFYASFVLCLIAFGVLVASVFIKRPVLTDMLLAILPLSIVLQIAGIGARIYILQRPPVSTLYETVLFVCALSMIYLTVMFIRNREVLWIWLCVCLGIILHILGFSHDQDGDSLVVLTAVLNTNFWLTTHVICITAGYAFCAVTSILSHYILLNMAWKRLSMPASAMTAHVKHAALIALFFSTIGTVLGGIWADQSWGRFWGWDPKENGALLIVLWLIWVLHGRISGQMKPVSALCALSFLSVILALSWFGVNLLNVGLHSYGFTDSAAGILGAFIGIELVFIGSIIFMIRKGGNHA